MPPPSLISTAALLARSRMGWRAGLCWTLLCLVSPLAAAQGPGLSTLQQAFDAAWVRQPEAQTQALLQQAAQGRQAAAQGWTAGPPSLELSSTTDRLARNEGRREWALGLALPLWLPGERQRSQALAQAEGAVVDSRTAAARWRLAGAVREAWWGWQRARVELDLARARQASAAQLAADVARRVAAGELARVDAHQAEAAWAAAQAEWAERQAALVQAEQGLSALAAEVPAAPVLPVPESTEVLGLAAAPLDTHPGLRELSDRLQRAERARDLVAVQQRAHPELTLASTRERGAVGERYSQTLSIGLRLPLGSTGQQQAQNASAAAEFMEAQTQLSLERQRVAGEWAAARARLSAAQAAAEAAGRRAELAREARGFIDKAFQAGEADLPSRLRVEWEAFEAERQATLARLQAHQALSTLHQALGLLPQ